MAAGLAFAALGACVTTGGSGAMAVDWPAFGAAVLAESPTERERLRAEAELAHRSAPTAETAIRLALLTAAGAAGEADLESALGLLDYAAAEAATAGDAGSLDFVRFYRPLLLERREREAALAAAVAARQALERQLNAFRELEERLNADDSEP